MNTFKQSPASIKVLLFVFVIATVASVALNVLLMRRLKSAATPQATAEAQLRETLADLGTYIVLPDRETPTLATVSDLAPLKDQPFFANAKIGDQVIIYPQARKAILWRPSERKIVEVAPLSTATSPAAPEPKATSSSRR